MDCVGCQEAAHIDTEVETSCHEPLKDVQTLVRPSRLKVVGEVGWRLRDTDFVELANVNCVLCPGTTPLLLSFFIPSLDW